MAKHATPLLDQLESGPWPSFVTGLKRLAKDKDYVVDVLGQLETSYKTRKGYWKGGTVGVFGYGGGVIPRFTELKDENDKPVQWLHGLYRPDRYEYQMQLSRVGGIDAKVWVNKELSANFH